MATYLIYECDSCKKRVTLDSAYEMPKGWFRLHAWKQGADSRSIDLVPDAGVACSSTCAEALACRILNRVKEET